MKLLRALLFTVACCLLPVVSSAQPTNQGHDGFWQCFRLTTESGVAVSTSDRTAQSTIYATPYGCDKMSIYSGLGNEWETVRSPEFSLALSSLTSGKNYDVFAYKCALALCLELSAAWTNDTTRADALATQNGRQIKNADKTRLFIGTIRTTGTTTTEDSKTKRFVFNYYNRERRHLLKADTTDNSYGSTTDRYYNNDSSNKYEFVLGAARTYIANVHGNLDEGGGRIASVIDWTTGSPTDGVDPQQYVSSSNDDLALGMPRVVGIGYHYEALIQASFGGATNYYTGTIFTIIEM